MTEGTAEAAGASPPCRSYDDASETFRRACEDRRQSVDTFTQAQQAYVDALNAMALPAMMLGDTPIVTDADSIEKVRSVLALGVSDEASRSLAEHRLVELRDHRRAKHNLATRHDLDRLGDEVVAATAAANSALDALMTVPAPTIAALAVKIEVEAYAPWRTSDHLLTLAADAHRLANLEADVASAWVDRWLALGGGFCRSRNMDGTDRGALRSIPMSYTWTPPAQQNPLLQPHEWIVEESDHTGAVKVLEGFLTLVPGLSDAVFAVAAEQGLLAKHGEFSHAA